MHMNVYAPCVWHCGAAPMLGLFCPMIGLFSPICMYMHLAYGIAERLLEVHKVTHGVEEEHRAAAHPKIVGMLEIVLRYVREIKHKITKKKKRS